MPPLAAIIMRSKNEMPHVRATLAMLARQTFRDYELFAVDSGSTDGSVDELRKHCNDLVEIEPDTYVPGKVLNDAITRTNYPIVVLLNADAIPRSEDWLEKLLRPIINDTADATFSRQVARPDAHFVVAYDYQRAYDPARIDPNAFSAVACAFRRELWERHPFPDRGYAEDVAWAAACRTDGARIRMVEDSVVEHSHNYTLKALYAKRCRQAATFNTAPQPGCARELVRDLLFAFRKLQLHTIPYNMAYRATIHAAFRAGMKKGSK